MENIQIKIGDIVMAKFGNSVFSFTRSDGTRDHCNLGIWGVVTDITKNEKTKQDDILVKLMFDATSSHTYKAEDLIVICSTGLTKSSTKPTLDYIKEQYQDSPVVMAETLASIPADGLSIEGAFELYMSAMYWSDGNRFFRIYEDRESEPLEEFEDGGWDTSVYYLTEKRNDNYQHYSNRELEAINKEVYGPAAKKMLDFLMTEEEHGFNYETHRNNPKYKCVGIFRSGDKYTAFDNLGDELLVESYESFLNAYKWVKYETQ